MGKIIFSTNEREKMKTIYFYSSVKTKKLFSIQSYYRNDIFALRSLGYKVQLSNSFLDFFFFWKYDIAFLYFYRYSCIPAFLSKLFFKKVYFTGGIDYLDKYFSTPKQRFVQGVFFRLCNLFSNGSILVSSADVENVKQLYRGKLPKNCSLSFHAVDIDRIQFKGTLDQKKNNYCTIAWMSNLDNVFRKGIDKAIDVFANIVFIQPDAKFFLAGSEGEGSRYVLEKIRALSLQNSVIYLGPISEEEKIVLLQRCKYYFQLSKYEGFGIAAVEALAAGCLVLHSGRGGLKDAVGKYGYKINIEKDICIKKLLFEIQAKFSDNQFFEEGMQYVRQRFSMQQRIDSFFAIMNTSCSKAKL